MSGDRRENLVLIGLRTSGKTTVGRLVAEAAGALFVDLDDEVVRAAGTGSVREIFEREGESGFRAMEVRCLEEVLERRGAVVALGGGTPTALGAAEMLREAKRGGTARVVYLRYPAEVLATRMMEGGAGADRPALTVDGGGAAEEMAGVYAARDPLYVELADLVVEGAGDAGEVVDRVLGWWRDLE